MTTFVITKAKAFSFPTFQGPSNDFMTTKLEESKRKVTRLAWLNLLVCPVLGSIVFLSVWSGAIYDNEQPILLEVIGYLVRDNATGYLVVSFLTLWVIYHTAELLLLVAISRNSVNYCRTYLTTIAPSVYTLTLISFSLVLWSALDPLDSNNMTKFIIAFGSSTILVGNFFSYHLKTLCEHTNYLSVVTIIDERSSLIEYI